MTNSDMNSDQSLVDTLVTGFWYHWTSWTNLLRLDLISPRLASEIDTDKEAEDIPLKVAAVGWGMADFMCQNGFPSSREYNTLEFEVAKGVAESLAVQICKHAFEQPMRSYIDDLFSTGSIPNKFQTYVRDGGNYMAECVFNQEFRLMHLKDYLDRPMGFGGRTPRECITAENGGKKAAGGCLTSATVAAIAITAVTKWFLA